VVDMALKRLEAHHLIAIGYLSLPKRGGKTMEEIAHECGVSRQSIYDFLKDDLFEKELKKQMVRNTQEKLPDLLESLVDIAMRDGNAAMAKLALQVNGMLTDKLEVETKSGNDAGDIEAMKERIEEYKRRMNKADE
jgi:predicted DNA-binding protein YlxM (UPF0122 family)